MNNMMILHQHPPGYVEAALIIITLIILGLAVFRWSFLREARGVRYLAKRLGDQPLRLLIIVICLIASFLQMQSLISS